ncbi:MAG: aryl-sulfate sulfotransferase [Acidobacteria bacterium]|nr:aryl-sulfate sulfotransferase [Acidobacteriota bacterium]
MRHRHTLLVGPVLAVAVLLGAPAYATPTIQQLTPSLPSPQPLGTTVRWTTTATDTDPGMLDYQYAIIYGLAKFMVRDYSLSQSFDLTIVDREGLYLVQVTVLNTSTNRTARLTVPFQATSRVVGGNAVVTATPNPLVALLSAPSCPAGSFMRGLYQLQGSAQVLATYWKPCHPPTSMNFYIAGMRAQTTTLINYQVATGSTLTVGPITQSFPSGALTITPPAVDVTVPPGSGANVDLGMVLHDYLVSSPPIATDLQGNVMWYYAPPGTPNAFVTRPLFNGTMLVIVDGTNSSDPNVTAGQVLREIDLAGNTVRETNASLVGQRLAALGVVHAGEVFGSFHHDAIRLLNGNTIVLGSMERIFPPGTQGSTDPLGVDVIGDALAVLDPNWNVIGGWNSFDHLDVNRAAVLGEFCPAPGGCPPLFLNSQTTTKTANDWLHSNSVQYIPSTGDLLLSMRHQDWVVKIDYKNGSGTGNILWRLGLGGDFAMNSSDPYPWFSHQHDVAYENLDATLISLFDNGNTRVAANPGGNNRGQLLDVDETTMQVPLRLNADLGVFSFALGSAQLLPNGNAHYQAGAVGPGANAYSIEVLPDGTIAYELKSGGVRSYRSWRMVDLYAPPGR